jgi:hypothetical protein
MTIEERLRKIENRSVEKSKIGGKKRRKTIGRDNPPRNIATHFKSGFSPWFFFKVGDIT